MQLPSRKQQREERRKASSFCLKANLLAATLVTAIIVLLSLLSYVPDDVTATSLRFLVDKGAESLMLLTVLVTGLASLGHVVPTARWSLEEMWRLLLVQLLSAGSLPPSYIRRPSPEIARLLLAVKLYEQGRISTGTAARLAGMERVPFLFELQRFGLSPIGVDPDELATDTANA